MLSSKLFTFITVYDEESIAGAAAKLNLTQPAVTNQLNLLEQKLGCPLFFRSKGQLTFTPEGELVADYAKKLRALHTQLQTELSEGTTSKHIKIGVNKTVDSDSVITNTISKFTASDPSISFTLQSDTTDNLYKKLNNYELDILLLPPSQIMSEYDYSPLVSENIYCVCHATHPLAQKKSVTIEDLMEYPFILRASHSSTRQSLEHALADVGKSIDDMNVAIEIDSKNTIVKLVRENMGITLLSESNYAKYKGRSLCFLPIEGITLKKEIYLIVRKDYRNKSFLEKFQYFYNLSV